MIRSLPFTSPTAIASCEDELFKLSYLPAREALPQFDTTVKRITAAQGGPLAFFVAMQPSVQAAMFGQLRLDRRVAILRIIEALRLYTTAHNGALPESLSQITEVPVPDDPATGKPFEYHLSGNSATLSSPPAGLPGPWPSYRIAIRKGP